jgi:hypothetical protein
MIVTNKIKFSTLTPDGVQGGEPGDGGIEGEVATLEGQ